MANPIHSPCLASASYFLLLATGCQHARTADAQAQFAQIDQLLHSGELDAALANASQAARENRYQPWVSRFQLETARIRQVQGQNSEVLRLLNQEWAPTSNPDLRAQRLCLLSLAYARAGDSRLATNSIEEADQIEQVSPSTKAEILAARARFAIQENHLTEAKSLLEKSLVTARLGKDSFAEATALVNLSVVGLQQDRYEDALEQSAAAARIAQSLGARVLLMRAVGNSGWAFYETGDYPRALSSFNDAASSAARLGATSDQEFWNNTAGMSEARMGNYAAAREHYTRAMALARILKTPLEVAQVDQSLASLELHSGHPARAASYVNEARTLARQLDSPFDIQLGDLLEAQLLTDARQYPAGEVPAAPGRIADTPVPDGPLDAEHTLTDVMEKAGDTHAAERWYQRSIATYR